MEDPPARQLRDLRTRVVTLEAEVIDLADQVAHLRKTLQKMAGRAARQRSDPPQTPPTTPLTGDEAELARALAELTAGGTVSAEE